MSVQTFPKHSEKKVSANYLARDFDCPCPYCTETLIDDDLLGLLDAMCLVLHFKLTVNSGFRCAHHQEDLRKKGLETSVGKSTHEDGKAADVAGRGLSGKKLEEIARKVGFKAVGVGKYFVHVDTRSDRERSWSYGQK